MSHHASSSSFVAPPFSFSSLLSDRDPNVMGAHQHTRQREVRGGGVGLTSSSSLSHQSRALSPAVGGGVTSRPPFPSLLFTQQPPTSSSSFIQQQQALIERQRRSFQLKSRSGGGDSKHQQDARGSAVGRNLLHVDPNAHGYCNGQNINFPPRVADADDKSSASTPRLHHKHHNHLTHDDPSYHHPSSYQRLKLINNEPTAPASAFDSAIHRQNHSSENNNHHHPNPNDCEDTNRKGETRRVVDENCVLCGMRLGIHLPLKKHLQYCPLNTASCPHCKKGIQIARMNQHILQCSSHGRSCFVCNRNVPASTYLTHVNSCDGGEGSGGGTGGGNAHNSGNHSNTIRRHPVKMYHGTSHEVAHLILTSQHLHPSSKGLLGEGVYVTADIKKALRYGPAVIECAVYPGKTIIINRRFHPLQKNWAAGRGGGGGGGYDSAWIPPNAFVSTNRKADEASASKNTTASATTLPNQDDADAAEDERIIGTRNQTGGDLEENCVADPRRVVPLRLVRGGGSASTAVAPLVVN